MDSLDRPRPRSGGSRFFSSYYISNACLIASYALVRVWFRTHGDLKYSKISDMMDLSPKVGLAVVVHFAALA